MISSLFCYSLLTLSQEGLRDVVVANPQWLADAFRCIVTFALVLPEGKLPKEQLQVLWREFPVTLHPFLIELMIRFNVFFPWRDGSQIWCQTRSPTQASSLCPPCSTPSLPWLSSQRKPRSVLNSDCSQSSIVSSNCKHSMQASFLVSSRGSWLQRDAFISNLLRELT